MSHNSAPRTHPGRHRPHVRDYLLNELFDANELELKLKIAEYRIIQAFFYATCWSHGKMRGTDNFIVGVGSRQKDLVKHIFEQVVEDRQGGIVTVSDLPTTVSGGNAVLREVARNAERRLLAVQLALMTQDQQIWFNEEPPGTWNIVPSLTDDYRLNPERAAAAYRIDQRLRREALHGGGRLAVVH